METEHFQSTLNSSRKVLLPSRIYKEKLKLREQQCGKSAQRYHRLTTPNG